MHAAHASPLPPCRRRHRPLSSHSPARGLSLYSTSIDDICLHEHPMEAQEGQKLKGDAGRGAGELCTARSGCDQLLRGYRALCTQLTSLSLPPHRATPLDPWPPAAFKEGRLEEAVALYTEALEEGGPHVATLCNRSLAALKLGRHAAARPPARLILAP